MSWFEGYPNPGASFPAEMERERKAMMDARKEFEGMVHPDSKKGREKEAKKDEVRKESAEKIQALEKQLAEERTAAAEKQKISLCRRQHLPLKQRSSDGCHPASITSHHCRSQSRSLFFSPRLKGSNQILHYLRLLPLLPHRRRRKRPSFVTSRVL